MDFTTVSRTVEVGVVTLRFGIGGSAVRVFILDGRRLTDEATFWKEYLSAVRPVGEEFFGRNLAAFRDAVTAGGPGCPGAPCCIRIEKHEAASVSPKFIAKVAEILRESDGMELVLA